MSNAKRDDNFVTTLLAVSSVDGVTPVTLYANPTTHRLLVDLAGGGSGTVQTVAVATANGFAGTSDGNAAAPTITLATSVTGILKGNGTAISAVIVGTGLAYDGTTLSSTATGNVTKVGTPADNQVGVWTGDGTIEGTAGLTFASNVLGVGTAANGTVQSNGNFDLTLQTGNATTGNITITDGANGNITLTPDGTGYVIASTDTFEVGELGQTIGMYTGAVNVELFGSDASSGSSFDLSAQSGATFMRLTDTSGGAAGPIIELHHDSASPASNDVVGEVRFSGEDSVGNKTTYASIKGVIFDPNSATEDGKLTLSLIENAVATDKLILISTALAPNTSNGLGLGTASEQFSDLFLAEGGVINWDNGDATLTQVGDVVTLAGADLKVSLPGNVSTSVVTTDATQTLTNKTLTSPTLTTPGAFTTGGTITLAENTSIALDPAGSADGKYSGITVTGTGGATIAFGELVYLAAADSRWELADADAEATAGYVMMGMAVTSSTDGAAITVLLQGIIRADSKFPALTIGKQVFVGETPGAIQVAIPTGADNVVRCVGFALTADEIYFNPSTDYQLVVA